MRCKRIILGSLIIPLSGCAADAGSRNFAARSLSPSMSEAISGASAAGGARSDTRGLSMGHSGSAEGGSSLGHFGCAHITVDPNPELVGITAPRAIALFLDWSRPMMPNPSSSPGPVRFPSTGWRQLAGSSELWVSGKATVTVRRISSDRWQVAEGYSC